MILLFTNKLHARLRFLMPDGLIRYFPACIFTPVMIFIIRFKIIKYNMLVTNFIRYVKNRRISYSNYRRIGHRRCTWRFGSFHSKHYVVKNNAKISYLQSLRIDRSKLTVVSQRLTTIWQIIIQMLSKINTRFTQPNNKQNMQILDNFNYYVNFVHTLLYYIRKQICWKKNKIQYFLLELKS